MRLASSAFVIVTVLASIGSGKDKNPKPNDTPKSDPAKGINFYSIEREIALGKQMAEEIGRQADFLADPVITEYVNRLGQNLLRNSDAKVPFNIKVIRSSEINAFALPGGFMFVNTGLILRAEGEAELAGVMAHEIAHVAARHGTRQATRGTIVNYSTIPLIFIGGWAGCIIRQAANVAVPMGVLQFSRALERQADHLGLEYMYKAGYDPLAFVDFFERIESLEKKKPGTISKLFSSHPPTRSRIASAQGEIQNDLKPRTEYVLDTSAFHEVRERLALLEQRGKNSRGDGPVLIRRSSSRNIDQGQDSDLDTDGRPTLKR